jgi:hypothetical protein
LVREPLNVADPAYLHLLLILLLLVAAEGVIINTAVAVALEAMLKAL